VNVMLLHNVFNAYQHFTSTKYGTRTRKYFILLPLNIDSRILRNGVHLNFQIRNILRMIVMDEEWPKHVLFEKSHSSHSLFEKYIAESITTFCLRSVSACLSEYSFAPPLTLVDRKQAFSKCFY